MSTGKLSVGGAAVVLWVALLGVFAPSALAAAPEAPGPVTVQSPVGATKALLHGVLSPASEGHPGAYAFLYKKGSASCEGESKAPESPGLMLGFEAEEVSQELTGLEPGTKYTVCLRAETKGGATVGPAVTFTTARALEAPTTTSPAGDVTAITATLLGALNPGAVAEAGESYEFRYRASGTECEGEGEIATSREAATGAKGEEVEAKLTELQPNTQYTFCLLAVNAAEETSVGAPVTFKTSTAPIAIADETFSEVRAHSANVSAQIDLGNESGSYLFQYGTPAEFQGGTERATAETQVSAVEGSVNATEQLAGLEPASEYEFQIVVTNASGETTPGAPEAFDTMAAEAAGLPDGRVYEMVTPPDNQDADVYVPLALPSGPTLSQGIETFWPFQAATDGDGVTYVAAPTSAGYGEGGKGLGNQYLARRSPGGGWQQTVLQPPGRRKTAYQAFSSDLTTGVLNSGSFGEPNTPPLTSNAPALGYSVLYTRDDFTETSVEEDLYRPLYTNSVAFNLDDAAFETSRYVNFEGKASQRPAFAGATSGFGELFFEANDDLTSPGDPLRPALDARIKAEPNGESDYLYDSVDERDVLVGVLPDGEVAGNATFGAVPLGTGEQNTPDFSGVVSSDGRWVYWTDLAAGPEENRVFVRENPGAPESPRDGHGNCTVAADACTVAVSAGPARYWTSAGEGRYVFYEESGQLLRYDALSKMSEPWTPASAGVLGLLGAGGDGSSAYLVGTGVLAGSSVSSQGVPPAAGEPNLYLLRYGSPPVFIATLNYYDGGEVQPMRSSNTGVQGGEFGDWQAGLGNRTDAVTADGLSAVFMSNRSLPVVGFPHGYTNDGAEEVYSYQADTNELFCISCSATGEPGGAGSYLPVSWSAVHLPEWVADEGNRVFFDSFASLVSQDTNGRQDVYEWERAGTGSCSAGAHLNGGCIYLLSGGASEADSWFVAASESGNDVFIVTRAQLTKTDRNDAFDLYDARVGGVEPLPEPACTGAGCQGVPAPPPTFATPPSNTYAGVGNFPPPTPSKPTVKVTKKSAKCKRGFVRKHDRCVKAKAKKRKTRQSNRRVK